MGYIILIVVLAVLILALGGTRLLRPRGSRGVRRRRAGDDPGTGTGTGTITRPGTGTDTAGSAAAEAPPVPRPAGPPAPPAPPVVEKPPPSAGRMMRLRARLARSQTGFGAALLGLLSRDRLDDDTWDEIEEVLITADVGVTPARQIVSELRTRVKVEGARTPDEVRGLLRTELIGQIGEDLDR